VQTSVSEGQEQPTNSETHVRQQEGEAKGFAKFANKKLKGIHGDWIDEK